MMSGSTPDLSVEQEVTEETLHELEAIPSDPNSTPYADLWKEFQKCLDGFNQKYKTPSANIEDETAFTKCHQLLTKIYEKGLETEKVPDNKIKEKGKKGKEMYHMFRELVGKSKTPPIKEIKGEKCAALMEEVLIPLLTSISKLQFDRWIRVVCFLATGTFIGTLIKEAGDLAKLCEAQLAKHKQLQNPDNGILIKLSIYAFKLEESKSEPVLEITNSLK